MGTSTNQGSPKRDPSWAAARAALGAGTLPAARQSQELWRAASTDKTADIASWLSSQALAVGTRFARTASDPLAAVRDYNEFISQRSATSVFTEIGRRALSRAVQKNGGAEGYAAELFAEAAAYYVSRDLPSAVAVSGRVGSTSAALELKRSILEVARRTAAEMAPRSKAFAVAQTTAGAQAAWKSYVLSVLATLRGESR